MDLFRISSKNYRFQLRKHGMSGKRRIHQVAPPHPGVCGQLRRSAELESLAPGGQGRATRALCHHQKKPWCLQSAKANQKWKWKPTTSRCSDDRWWVREREVTDVPTTPPIYPNSKSAPFPPLLSPTLILILDLNNKLHISTSNSRCVDHF